MTADKAVTALGNFKTKIGEADGAVGKFKAAGTVAFDTLKQNAANFALAAGASIAAWGVKAISDFQSVALEAGKFADAVGISVEDASRWLEVAGDYGVETKGIEGAMLKFNQALGQGRIDVADWGGEIIRAKDGTILANASFVDAVTKIGAMKDPTERAKAAQEAFGRRYKEVAELMELDAGELKAALDGVSESKVISEEELAKARDFRAAMDELKDRFEDITLWVGGHLVPAVTDAFEKFDKLAVSVGKVDDVARKVTGSGVADWAGKAYDEMIGLDNIADGLHRTFDKDSTAAGRFVGAAELVFCAVPFAGEALQGLGEKLDGTRLEFKGLTEAAIAHASELRGDFTDAATLGVGHLAELEAGGREYKDSIKLAEQATKDFDAAVKGMLGEVNAEQAWLDIKDKVDGFAADMAAAKGDTDAERLVVLSLKEAMIEYTGSLEGIPVEKKTEILALIDEENFRLVEAELAKLEKSRFPVYTPVFNGGGAGTGGVRYGATGGIVTKPTLAVIGEAGPEMVLPLDGAPGASPLPSGMGSAGGNTYITNNITTGADERRVVDVIKRYERRGGRL